MKAFPIIIAIVAGTAGGAIAGLLASDKAPVETTEVAALTPGSHGAAGPATDATARAEIQSLQLEMANLRMSVERLLSEVNRESASTELAPTEAATTAGDSKSVADLSSLSEQDKEEVFALMEEAREVQRQEQRVEREARMNEWTLERATQIADELGLPAGSEKRLGEILLDRNAQFSAMRAELNDLGWGRETRDMMRTRSEEINQWRTTALVNEFGQTTAEQIEGLSGDRSRGFGGGGNRGGGPR